MQDPATESTRPGLARFRSAPTTWLDALLEDHDSLKLHQGSTLSQLITSAELSPSPNPNPNPNLNLNPLTQPEPATPDPGLYGGGQESTAAAFQRMNSSPAEFLGANMEGYFSSFGNPTTSVNVSPSGKRMREHDHEQHSPIFAGQRRGELATANSLIEMEMEKLLEDSVPCRVRAKRGFATHPRSIAERVRRTRISDRIRKLEELVPNMDKQTNTADMLEEAVEYVKTLQMQIQELTEQQNNCKCMPKS